MNNPEDKKGVDDLLAILYRPKPTPADGQKPKPAKQMAIRRDALEMRKHGVGFPEIGRRLGVHPRTVQHWCAQALTHGDDMVIHGGKRGVAVGANRTLTADQEQEIRASIAGHLPSDQAFRLPFRIWSRDAVQALIEQKFQLSLSARLVANYLTRWGVLPRKPVLLVKKGEHYQAIAREAKTEGGEIFWGGETDVPMLFNVEIGSNLTVRMIYALTNRGQKYFLFESERLRERNSTWPVLLDALGKLSSRKSSPRRAFIILPAALAEHEPLTSWNETEISRTVQRSKVFFLPKPSDEQ
jgi:transposase